MFAPAHHKVAVELLRVCRPGGVVGMINFTPEGAGGDFFRVLAPYAPPPPADALPPLLRGRWIESFLHLSAAGIEARPARESRYRTNTYS